MEYSSAATSNLASVMGMTLADTVAQIVKRLVGALQQDSHIAEKVCFAISQLAAGSNQIQLAVHFEEVLTALMTTVSHSPPPVSLQPWVTLGTALTKTKLCHANLCSRLAMKIATLEWQG